MLSVHLICKTYSFKTCIDDRYIHVHSLMNGHGSWVFVGVTDTNILPGTCFISETHDQQARVVVVGRGLWVVGGGGNIPSMAFLPWKDKYRLLIN